MKKVFIIHGYGGTPNGGWRPWLMGELEKQEVYACALSMPKPDFPILSEWVEEIARHVKENSTDDIYLVGHSLGVPAILNYLMDTTATNIKGAVLVAGPIKEIENKDIAEFVAKPFDFGLIKTKAKSFAIIHGDNDPRVDFAHAEILSKELDAKLTKIENGGHLNGSSGWLALPQALEALEEMMM